MHSPRKERCTDDACREKRENAEERSNPDFAVKTDYRRRRENISYESADKSYDCAIPEAVKISREYYEYKHQVSRLPQKTERFRERYLQRGKQENIDRINDYLPDPGFCIGIYDTHG